MSKEDLIPITTTERAKELGRLGGIVKTPQKQLAAKLREIRKRVKKGQLKTDDEEWLLERATDSQLSAINIMSFCDEIRQMEKVQTSPHYKIQLGNLYKEVHKMTHGEKRTNVNLNIDMAQGLVNAAKEMEGEGIKKVEDVEEENDDT